MMSSIAIVLSVFWLLGSISSHTIGGYLHLFLAIAIMLMLPRFVLGRKVTV